MKRCPHCAEEIQDAALVCKHCGRDVTPDGVRRTAARWGVMKQAERDSTWAVMPEAERQMLTALLQPSGAAASGTESAGKGSRKSGCNVLLFVVLGGLLLLSLVAVLT